ncbi:MAG: hypothetical protein EZS28_025845 [Streblomastix strix]|uniref:FHA domain-containing protein n=1 Tax=Streblomastix strix TaxID=222440 RepID=A0A5J4V7I0_9EUKA|nr:MAG: hypothetical protein EZS28_025845 [Streblomastix strix]
MNNKEIIERIDEHKNLGRLIGKDKIFVINNLMVVIGRGDDCDLVLDSKSISKRHCSLNFADEEGEGFLN